MFFVGPAARSAISRLCNDATVYVESGRLTGFGGVRLKGVIIAENRDELKNQPVFRFDCIDVHCNPWKLLRGKLEIDSISLSDFLFNAAYKAKGQWNFYPLLRPQTEFQAPPEKIPLVEIKNGVMRIAQFDASGTRAVTTVSLNGQIAVQTGKREYSFMLTTDGRFGFGGSLLEGVLKVGQTGELNHLSAHGTIRMPGTKVFENAWDMDNLHLECEFDRDQVNLKRCTFGLGDGSLDAKGIIWKKADAPRRFNVDLNIQQFALSDQYQRNAVVYSEPILQLMDPRLRDFLMQYHPVGTGDVRLQIRGQLKDLADTDINGTLTSRDIRIRDEKFPYPLEHVQGTIVLSGRDIDIHQLTAKHGSVDLEIDGRLKNLGPNREIDVRTTSRNMLFDKDLYNALNPSMQKVWHSFSPTGTAAVDYHFQRFADGNKEVTLVLEFKEAGLVYEHFPYPLENLTGTVIMAPDRVVFKDIVSHYEDQRRVTLNGQVLEIHGSQPAFQIHVQAQQIPVDERFVNAMPSAQQAFFHQFDLDAVADIEVEVFPNQTGRRALDYMAKIRLNAERFLYEDFPLPMSHVQGTADVTHEMIRLNHFEGTTDGGKVEFRGIVTPNGSDPDKPGLCLDVDLKGYDFNETFWTAAGDDADRILGKLRFKGRTDISGHVALNLAGGVCAQNDLRVEFSGNPLFQDDVLLGRASGRIQLIDDTVRLSAFQLQEIQIESLPAQWLTGKWKSVYDGIDAEGHIGIRIDEGQFRLAEGHLESLDLNGGLHLEKLTIGRADTIHGLVGDVDGHLAYNRAQNRVQVLTLCDIDRLNYHQWEASGVRGQLVYDPNTRRFEGRQLTGHFYGGTLDGHIDVNFSHPEEMGYRLTLSAADVDVSRLPGPDGHNSVGHLTQGLAFGRLTVEGDLRDISQSQGQATIRVDNMQLGQQSTLGKVLTAMQFKKPQDYVFSELKASVLLEQGRILIEDIRMAGKPLVFRGKGVVDLNQKQIQMDWVAFDRFVGSEDTILDRLARGIGSAIWKVEVRGDIQDPQVNAVFLSVLTQPLDIFKKKEQ